MLGAPVLPRTQVFVLRYYSSGRPDCSCTFGMQPLPWPVGRCTRSTVLGLAHAIVTNAGAASIQCFTGKEVLAAFRARGLAFPLDQNSMLKIWQPVRESNPPCWVWSPVHSHYTNRLRSIIGPEGWARTTDLVPYEGSVLPLNYVGNGFEWLREEDSNFRGLSTLAYEANALPGYALSRQTCGAVAP